VNLGDGNDQFLAGCSPDAGTEGKLRRFEKEIEL
jgi:hypothetical protein